MTNDEPNDQVTTLQDALVEQIRDPATGLTRYSTHETLEALLRATSDAIYQFAGDKGRALALLLEQYLRALYDEISERDHDEALHDSAPTLDAVTISAASALVRHATGRADYSDRFANPLVAAMASFQRDLRREIGVLIGSPTSARPDPAGARPNLDGEWLDIARSCERRGDYTQAKTIINQYIANLRRWLADMQRARADQHSARTESDDQNT
jgi:hypothetical protein